MSDYIPPEEMEANRVHSQPDGDDRDPLVYLGEIVNSRIMRSLDLDEDAPAGYEGNRSDLFLQEFHRRSNGVRQVRLRLKHPDSSVSDISARLTLREMETFLRGLSRGASGYIDDIATHAGDDTEGDQ